MAKVTKENFTKELERQLAADINAVRDKLGDYIDQAVISAKFENGFPGHKLQKSTIQHKGSAKVGIDTGKLFAAATALTSYSVFNHESGKKRPLLIKKKAGLTAYSHLFRTKEGGEVDFLQITSSDTVRIGKRFTDEMKRRGYQGNGQIRVINRGV